MNDFDYDVMQKKRIARGSYNRKRGSKSKKMFSAVRQAHTETMEGEEWKSHGLRNEQAPVV